MKNGMKELHIAVLAAAISIFLTGCQSREEQITVAEPAEPAVSTEPIMPSEDTEEEGFILDSQNVFIPFSDCTCEYDNGDLQIYTKYFEDGNEYFLSLKQ